MGLERFLKKAALVTGLVALSSAVYCPITVESPNMNTNNNTNMNSSGGGNTNTNTGGNNNTNTNTSGNTNTNTNDNTNDNTSGGGIREGNLVVRDGFSPNLSPNGNKIAFMRLHYDGLDDPYDGQTDIWMVNIDGSGLKRVTNTPEDEFYPKFTPNNSHLVYGRTQGDFFAHDPGLLYATNTNGDNEGLFLESPFGEDVLVKDFCFYNGITSAIPGDTPNERKLTVYAAEDNKIWMLNGEENNFHSGFVWSALRTNDRLFHMDASGNSEYMVTNSPQWDKVVRFNPVNLEQETITDQYSFAQPAISPNGEKIIVGANGGIEYGLYTMDINGNNLTRVTDGLDGQPDWDGETVVFGRIPQDSEYTSFEFGDIYRINLDQ